MVGVPDAAKTLQGIGLANKHPGIEDIGALLTPNMEKIVAVNPDLILGTMRNREAYNLFKT